MADRVEIFITRVINDGGQAFGVRADNDETVYLPRSVCLKLDPEPGDHILVVITPNRDETRRATVPWFAIHGEHLDPEME